MRTLERSVKLSVFKKELRANCSILKVHQTKGIRFIHYATLAKSQMQMRRCQVSVWSLLSTCCLVLIYTIENYSGTFSFFPAFNAHLYVLKRKWKTRLQLKNHKLYSTATKLLTFPTFPKDTMYSLRPKSFRQLFFLPLWIKAFEMSLVGKTTTIGDKDQKFKIFGEVFRRPHCGRFFFHFFQIKI